jgi:hypothetical protein
MPQNQLAELLLEASREAGRRLQAQAPHTPEWIQAQRDLVRIRADYWDEMRKVWKTADRPVPSVRGKATAKTAATEHSDG